MEIVRVRPCPDPTSGNARLDRWHAAERRAFAAALRLAWDELESWRARQWDESAWEALVGAYCEAVRDADAAPRVWREAGSPSASAPG